MTIADKVFIEIDSLEWPSYFCEDCNDFHHHLPYEWETVVEKLGGKETEDRQEVIFVFPDGSKIEVKFGFAGDSIMVLEEPKVSPILCPSEELTLHEQMTWCLLYSEECSRLVQKLEEKEISLEEYLDFSWLLQKEMNSFQELHGLED